MSYNLAELFPAGTEWRKQETANILAEIERAKVKKPALRNAGLPAIDPRDWQGRSVPERKWFVDGWIPDRTVTNLSGDGGSGKTEIILQLLAASSLGLPWFGKQVSVGPCLYYGAEDEADELHRRLETIVASVGKQLSDLDGVRLIPMAGLDAVLAEPDRKGNLAATAIYPKLVSQAMALRPKLIVIDPSADVFGGDEINRAQVLKFVSMLRALAMEIDCAVLLLSHPSIAGMNSGTGTSGSTAWNNSVRSRLYLEITSPDTTLTEARLKRSELQVQRSKLIADCLIIRARMQKSPSAGNEHDNRVRKLLGKPTLADELNDRDQLNSNQSELTVIDASISTLDAEILKQSQIANNKLIASKRNEIAARGGKFAKALVDLCAADLDYEKYLDSLEDAGATVGQFRIRLSGLGSPRDISSGYAYSMRDMIDAGFMTKSELPKAYK